jgi:hypothetical protein
MKLYRAIEFSKLIFMLSSYGKDESNRCNKKFIDDKLNGKNWWLNNSFNQNVQHLIADVVANGHKNFFQKSLTYNSIVGGRYNPANSFGILYTASNPALAALEVIYHIFDSKKKFLKTAQQNKSIYEDVFNSDHPSTTRHLLVIFELEIESPNLSDCRGDKAVKDLCERIGFGRYTADSGFDEDFIFGNNYEVSRLAGNYLNTLDAHNCYQFRSARIPNEAENHDYFNVIIPERFIEDLNPQLTGHYFLADTGIDIAESENHHKIGISFIGNQSQKFFMRLEKPPAKRLDKDLRSIRYMPVLPDEFQPHLNSRYVCHQRFKNLQ